MKTYRFGIMGKAYNAKAKSITKAFEIAKSQARRDCQEQIKKSAQEIRTATEKLTLLETIGLERRQPPGGNQFNAFETEN